MTKSIAEQKLINAGFSAAKALLINDLIQQNNYEQRKDIQQLTASVNALCFEIEKMEMRLIIKLGSLLAGGISILSSLKFFI